MKKILKSKTLVIFFIISLLAFHLIGCDNAVQEPTATENVQVVEAEQQEVAATPDENVTEENMTPKNDVVEENAAESAENAEDVDVEIDVEANTESEENVTEETTAEETEEEAEEIVEEEVVAEEIATPEVVPVPETSQVSTSIKPSDFKFCGYPVNENHYQEWKTALGYLDNGNSYETITDTNLGTYIIFDEIDGAYVIIGGPEHTGYGDINNLYSFFEYYLLWGDANGNYYDGGHRYAFIIRFNKIGSYASVLSTIYNGPVNYGMSFDEVKQLVGYNESLSVEEDSFKICTLSDGTQIMTYLNDSIYIDNPGYIIRIYFQNNMIDEVSVYFDI